MCAVAMTAAYLTYQSTWRVPAISLLEPFSGKSRTTASAGNPVLRFGLILLKNSVFWVCFRKFGPLKPLNFQGAVDHVSAIESLNDLACCLHECFTESHANDIYDQSNFSNPRKSSFSTELALLSQ